MSLMPMRLPPLGIDRVGAGLGGARLLLEPRGLALLGGGLGAARALRRLGGALLRAAVGLRRRGTLRRVELRGGLGPSAVALGGLLGALRLSLGRGLGALRLARAPLRLELRVGGRLLQPALAGQLLVAEDTPGGRLHLAGEAPQGAAGGPFCLVLGHPLGLPIDIGG